MWPNLAQSLSSVGGRTPGSKNLQESCSSACFLQASRVALQRPRSPCPRASCLQRRGVEAAERPRQPGGGGGRAGAAGPRSAPSSCPLHRTSYPAPTYPAQPLRETRRKRVASPGGSAEVERSWRQPRAGRTLRAAGGETPPPRSLPGCLSPAEPAARVERGGEGVGRERNLKLCEGIRSR